MGKKKNTIVKLEKQKTTTRFNEISSVIFIPVQSTVREHRQLKIHANSNFFPLFLVKTEIAFEVVSFRGLFQGVANFGFC